MPGQDDFARLLEIEKASIVMLHGAGLVTTAEAAAVAGAVRALSAGDGGRPTDYAEIQALLEEAGGPDALAAHLGRSRVDLNRTVRRMAQRDACLAALGAAIRLRRALLDLALRHRDSLLPAYTLGVQAQPTTLGHYLSGHITLMERQCGRLQDAYRSINLCPLGAAALATSSFPIDRPQLATLLGFAGALENSFDAVQLATLDTNAEVLGTTSNIALSVSLYLADLERQYRSTNRYFTLGDPRLTGFSTLMPQKRNPDEINRLRLTTADILGLHSTYVSKSHNMPHGMPDYAGHDAANALDAVADLLESTATMTAALLFDAAKAEAEITADYSTATELASRLQQAGMRLHASHAYVSVITDHGRSNGFGIGNFPYDAACDLYASGFATKALPALPLDADAFREALSPHYAVRARRALGGSQPAEVARMLDAHEAAIARDLAGCVAQARLLQSASAGLDAALERIVLC